MSLPTAVVSASRVTDAKQSLKHPGVPCLQSFPGVMTILALSNAAVHNRFSSSHVDSLIHRLKSTHTNIPAVAFTTGISASARASVNASCCAFKLAAFSAK